MQYTINMQSCKTSVAQNVLLFLFDWKLINIFFKLLEVTAFSEITS